jgi:ankyrin repeat protein
MVLDSVLSFAVYAELILCTRQKLRNTDIFRDGVHIFLLHFAVEVSVQSRSPGSSSIIELLLNNSANIHHVWGGETPFQHLMNTSQYVLKKHDGPLWNGLSKVAEVFLKHGQDANVDIPYSPGEALGGTSKKFSKALHIARADFSKILLEHGAHVNALDSDGLTALDHVIHEVSILRAYEDFVTASILLEHGGCITESTGEELIHFLNKLNRSGIEIPEALRNPPRLQGQMTLAQRLRSLVPSFLGVK